MALRFIEVECQVFQKLSYYSLWMRALSFVWSLTVTWQT